MNCPNCNTVLLMSDKHGVEIDYCPACRGIWLDRGELEKIMERENAYLQTGSSRVETDHAERYSEHHDHDSHGKYYGQKGPYPKKKGFLSNLLDFD